MAGSKLRCEVMSRCRDKLGLARLASQRPRAIRTVTKQSLARHLVNPTHRTWLQRPRDKMYCNALDGACNRDTAPDQRAAWMSVM